MNFDKNIPLPAQTHGGWPKKYFFEQMELMDSQQFPLEKRNSVNSAIMRATKKTGFKYRIRKIDCSIRVWRIK